MKVRDIALALLLSMTLSFGAAFSYAFYPIITAVFRATFVNAGTAGTSGVGAVAGGVSSSFLFALLILEPFMFLIIFALLRAKCAAR